MKKNGLLHAELLNLICTVGHGDYIIFTDRGFPLPSSPYTKVIDLGIAPGFPDFKTIISLVLPELAIDWIYFTEETKGNNPDIIKFTKSLVPENTGFSFMKHPDLKEAILNPSSYHEKTKNFSKEESRANGQLLDQSRIIGFIRTGEFTKYTNIVVECGVSFS